MFQFEFQNKIKHSNGRQHILSDLFPIFPFALRDVLNLFIYLLCFSYRRRKNFTQILNNSNFCTPTA